MQAVRFGFKLVMVGLVLAGCAISPAAPPRAPAKGATTAALPAVALDGKFSCGNPALREIVVAQVNKARASGRQCGTNWMPPASPLAWNEALFSAAARHSGDMARRNYFDHVTPEGARAGQRVSAQGYRWRGVAENIAAGDRSVERVVEGWLRSPGHCANIMQPEYADVAVACVERDGSTWGTYWTMNLGRRQD